MPTIFSHIAVPLALGVGLGKPTVSRRLLLAGMAASVLPDLDVVAFRLGIAYSHVLGHRGFSHSLLFALLVGALAAACARWLHAGWRMALGFVLVATASHGLLDMLTNGGLGVAYFWPFTAQRFFLGSRPIQVSPFAVDRLFSATGLAVFRSELLWVWLPATALLLACWAVRPRQS